MATKIEWAEETWNPVTGCTPISPGCDNCYARRMATRLAGRFGYPADEPFRVTVHPERFDEPLKWKKPRRVFVCSMGDLFHESVPFQRIHQIWDIIKACPQHTFLVLTKRPERMKEAVELIYRKERFGWALGFFEHIWLGVTAENQEQADKRIPILLSIPADVRFLSVEPMLGPINLEKWLPIEWGEIAGDWIEAFPGKECYKNRLHWVICGGESGPGARLMHPDWARSLRDQCQAAGVPFMFKQWGEWQAFYDRDKDDPDWQRVPKSNKNVRRINLVGGCGFHGERVVYCRRIGKKKAGRLLDGREWNEYPEVATNG